MTTELEATDRRILQLLAHDGRMSFTDLGKATGLSTSAVHQRVKRLEQRGLILGYGATIDHDEVGLPLTAFISIRPIDPSQPDDSPERVRDIPEIESCWSVAGEESYILKIRVSTPVGPRGPAGPHPGRGERVDPDDDRAVDAVREPAGRRGLTSTTDGPAQPRAQRRPGPGRPTLEPPETGALTAITHPLTKSLSLRVTAVVLVKAQTPTV